ncbi:MAG TPA: hypothetical protein EYP17_10735 [Candidatus Latescibacteria bacterium]|nr:hypothetical protein [Candidatus Latescibacterota bacterium]
MRWVLTCLIFVCGCASEAPLLERWRPGPEWWAARFEEYGPEDLFSYIDGGAEAFLRCGFRRLEVGEYEGPEETVVVEVYDMGSSEGARCIYGVYGIGGKPLRTGDEGTWVEGGAYFREGKFFVRVLGEGNTPANVARSLSGNLP